MERMVSLSLSRPVIFEWAGFALASSPFKSGLGAVMYLTIYPYQGRSGSGFGHIPPILVCRKLCCPRRMMNMTKVAPRLPHGRVVYAVGVFGIRQHVRQWTPLLTGIRDPLHSYQTYCTVLYRQWHTCPQSALSLSGGLSPPVHRFEIRPPPSYADPGIGL